MLGMSRPGIAGIGSAVLAVDHNAIRHLNLLASWVSQIIGLAFIIINLAFYINFLYRKQKIMRFKGQIC